LGAYDGVMPQTVDDRDAWPTPLIFPSLVAVNKIDKPGAMPSRVKKQTGGSRPAAGRLVRQRCFGDVSAKQKTNLISDGNDFWPDAACCRK